MRQPLCPGKALQCPGRPFTAAVCVEHTGYKGIFLLLNNSLVAVVIRQSRSLYRPLTYTVEKYVCCYS